ncbi:hypothetical protein CBM2631_A250197 [Cupriavidus taiwanensis]|nr:hypothetical protein CBM2617_A260049 [Cupriavidus taiwanensis]SOZ79739.1 hypothetical protein CBM2618_A230052 [Cupriavidus taiwanensis]SOZ87904.1 hypothetical protein CBM2621_A210197 [Cupriavidus taiwanensis]SPA15004.1 hypothetical protein CBM2631_A250197 [Cupriavidus taiwanensis]
MYATVCIEATSKGHREGIAETARRHRSIAIEPCRDDREASRQHSGSRCDEGASRRAIRSTRGAIRGCVRAFATRAASCRAVSRTSA